MLSWGALADAVPAEEGTSPSDSSSEESSDGRTISCPPRFWRAVSSALIRPDQSTVVAPTMMNDNPMSTTARARAVAVSLSFSR